MPLSMGKPLLGTLAMPDLTRRCIFIFTEACSGLGLFTEQNKPKLI